MKEHYEGISMEIIEFDSKCADVITQSLPIVNDDDED